jgi:Mycothiol maleylpyruvate isomerase N-terminal domain
MTRSDRDTMLSRGDALWEQLSAALDASTDTPVNEAGWTGRDVFAHFARWQQHTIDDLRDLIVGKAPLPVDGDENVVNDRWYSEDRALPAGIARERCLRTREELRSLLLGLSDEQWDRFGRACAPDVSGEQYAAHLQGLTVKEPPS